MRRILTVLVAVVLVGWLAGSSLAVTARSSFHGDFDLLAEDGTVLGHVKADLSEPTDKDLVAGAWDATGAFGAGIRESHAVIGTSAFWYDGTFLGAGATIPGAYVGRGDGFECVYYGPNQADCHPWAVQYVDNVDPTVRDEVQFYGSWGEVTQFVGDGTFQVRVAGT
jgi:hypothetical protein